MKHGVTLSNVYIMNEGNGLVFDVEESGEAGTNVSILPLVFVINLIKGCPI